MEHIRYDTSHMLPFRYAGSASIDWIALSLKQFASKSLFRIFRVSFFTQYSYAGYATYITTSWVEANQTYKLYKYHIFLKCMQSREVLCHCGQTILLERNTYSITYTNLSSATVDPIQPTVHYAIIIIISPEQPHRLLRASYRRTCR